MTMMKYDDVVLCPNTCPSRMVLEMMADKWKLLVFHALRQEKTLRNGELMRALEGVSQKMLTQTLKSLVRDGLVRRSDFQEVPPRVEYSLTQLGLSLCEPIAELSDWGARNFDKVEAARVQFDAAE